MFDEPLVIDDFYLNPESIRRRALKLKFERQAHANYPGFVAPTFQNAKDQIRNFSKMLSGIKLDDRGFRQGDFRVALKAGSAQERLRVHTDPSTWSVVVYLTQRRHDGTLFFRHRKTGWSKLYGNDDVEFREAVNAGHFKNEKEMVTFFTRDTKDPAAWELIRKVPARFNRMVLFRGVYFHSTATESFGKTLGTGRLTQHFFFSPRPTKECPVLDVHVKRSAWLANRIQNESSRFPVFNLEGGVSP